MEATQEELLQLLELQKVDSAIDRLNARMRNMPETAELEELGARLRSLEQEEGEVQVGLNDVGIRQRRLENEIDSVSKKMAMEEKRLNSGDVSNVKELSSLAAEVESLKRRKYKFEDDELEVMQEAETLGKKMAELRADIDRTRDEIDATEKRREANAGQLAEELETARPQREHWASRTRPELLTFYDQIRAAKGGVGAAALQGSTCLGCHMQLPAQEVERLRRTPGVLKCEECGRILVVTGKA